MLNIHELTVVYPDQTRAIDQLNLTLVPGENVALIGANGAGKTSLILSIVGLLDFVGEITVGDVRLDKRTANEVRAKVGVVFQNPDDQLFMPTIYEDIAFGLRNQSIPENEIEARITGCLERLRIGHLREKTPLKMSGGEKRMAALATVLAMEPDVMLFDEPTAFLDPKARRNLIGVLGDLPQSKLIATHDLTFAAEVCGRSVLLKEGRVFADGPSRELLYDAALMAGCDVEAIGVYEGWGKF